MNITYTNEEAKAAIQLYDMAVKYGGLGVAEAAIALTKKFNFPQEVTEPDNGPNNTK